MGDEAAEVLLIIENEVGTIGSDQELNKIYQEFRSLPEDILAQKICDRITHLVDSQRLLTIIDQGGVVDDEGALQPWIVELIQTLEQTRQGYFVIVSRRKPIVNSIKNKLRLPQIRVPPLTKSEAAMLLRSLFARHRLSATSSNINDLAEQVQGYPPAAYYAAELAATNGVEMVLRDTGHLARLTEGVFLRQLEQDSRIGTQEQNILVLLASYSPLPLSLIGTYCRLDDEDLHRSMQYLLDTSLIHPRERGYEISQPIIHSISRLFPTLNVRHAELVTLIERELEQLDPDDDRRLSLQRLLYRAARYAGTPTHRDIILRFGSDEIIAARELYYEQEYGRAAEVAKAALDERPASMALRDLYIRALIQSGQYPLAGDEIHALAQMGRSRDAHFLQGFLLRKQEKHRDAIESFERARRLGLATVALHREMAQCYFELKNYQDARNAIKRAEGKTEDNPFIIDLKCQIATELGDREEAYDALSVLEFIDKPEYYFQRKSRVDFRFGELSEALLAARSALRATAKPSFQSTIQMIKMLIEVGEVDEAADYLDQLDTRFRGRHQDIRKGLRIKLLNASGRYDDALALWEQLGDKSLPVHKSLKRSSLRIKSDRVGLLPEEQEELQRLTLGIRYAQERAIEDAYGMDR